MFTKTLHKTKQNSPPNQSKKSSPNTSFYTCKECHFPEFPFSAWNCQILRFFMQRTQGIQVFLGAFSSKEQLLRTGMNRLRVTRAARLTSYANNAARGSSSQWAIISQEDFTTLRVSKVLDWSELIKPHKPPERQREGREGEKRRENDGKVFPDTETNPHQGLVILQEVNLTAPANETPGNLQIICNERNAIDVIKILES